MKNIHVLPTDKPSRLYSDKGKLWLDNLVYGDNNQHIYITSDEEIKEGDWYLDTFNTQRIKANKSSDHKHYGSACKKIILTTDPSLATDVRAINDTFLEWFVKNPSCEEVEVDSWSDDLDGYWLKKYKIIIPKEEPKQETLEEAAIKHSSIMFDHEISDSNVSFKAGAKWQQERSYSEEDIALAFNEGQAYSVTGKLVDGKEWVKQHKKEWFEKKYNEKEVNELLQKALTHKDDGEIGSLVTAQGEIRTANFFSWFEKFKNK